MRLGDELTRPTLCAAPAMLLIALTLCPVSTTRTAAAPHAVTAVDAAASVPTATVTTAAQVPAEGRPAAHHAVTSAHRGDCHAGDACSVEKAYDTRVGQFLLKYVQGAQTPEPGAACTGGLTAS